jgi:hypothetical protein
MVATMIRNSSTRLSDIAERDGSGRSAGLGTGAQRRSSFFVGEA